MNQITHIQTSLDLAEQVCKENSVRLTQKRRQVLVLLLLTKKAVSAYELISMFKAHYNEVLLPMTAYRTLEFLEEVKLAHRLNIANKYVACSLIGCKSSHELPHFLICQQCLRVDELENHTIQDLSDLTNKAQKTGYQLSSPKIELNGICNKCLQTENNC